ncbi:hypothetical protein PVK06_022441 [Gossypium arboreum]|uniref:Uncharacterized protein n=1 Tax=Gossypium arboreum TaxID=29729 RepID=A0ABR0P8G3_GOSAR|nr:hypothetical protein PVK06_022441 [Gossypium arboreum]
MLNPRVANVVELGWSLFDSIIFRKDHNSRSFNTARSGSTKAMVFKLSVLASTHPCTRIPTCPTYWVYHIIHVSLHNNHTRSSPLWTTAICWELVFHRLKLETWNDFAVHDHNHYRLIRIISFFSRNDNALQSILWLSDKECAALGGCRCISEYEIDCFRDGAIQED